MNSASFDMFPLFQLFLLVCTTLLFHIGLSNPNPTSIDDYVPYESIISTFTVFILPKMGKLLMWIATIYQIVYLYLEIFWPAAIVILFPQISMGANPLPLTFVSILGYMLIFIGGIGRIWCYRTLGVFFTFELTIRSTHKLVMIGPYAYVRHPSYTFVFILTIGMCLVHHRLKNFFPNTIWIQIQCGPMGFVTTCLIALILIRRRVVREEEELAIRFGKTWYEYATKTKRFIPKIV